MLCAKFFRMLTSKRLVPDSSFAKVIYTVKKVSDFPVARRDVTKQSLPGRK